MPRALQFGLFDFGDPSLLVQGDKKAIMWLADHIAERRPLTLEQDNGTRTIKLSFVPTAASGCLTKIGDDFTLAVSPSEAKQGAEMLQSLARSKRAAHCYLAPAINDTGVQIIVSLGEYDTRIFLSPNP